MCCKAMHSLPEACIGSVQWGARSATATAVAPHVLLLSAGGEGSEGLHSILGVVGEQCIHCLKTHCCQRVSVGVHMPA